MTENFTRDIGTVATFPVVPTDKERADAIRTKLQPLLEQLVATFNDAERDGLIVTFNIGRNQYGRHAVQNIAISKPL